ADRLHAPGVTALRTALPLCSCALPGLPRAETWPSGGRQRAASVTSCRGAGLCQRSASTMSSRLTACAYQDEEAVVDVQQQSGFPLATAHRGIVERARTTLACS